MRQITLPFLLLLLCASQLPAQLPTVVWEDEVTVNANASLGRVRPRIALAGEVPVVVWGNPSGGAVRVAVMQGDTFGLPVQVNAGGHPAYVRNWIGPSIAAVEDTVMVTYDQMDASEEGAVWFHRSTDRGLTWATHSRVDVATGNGMTRLGTLVALDGRRIICGYVLADSNDANAEGHLARSTDGGLTWLPSYNATAGAPGLMCDCCPPGLAAEGDKVAFLFRNNDANIRDVRAAISLDAGLSIAATHDLDPRDWDIASCPSTGPDGHLHGDSLTHVWMYGDVSPSRVFVGTAHTGTGAGAVVALNDTAAGAQNFPRVAGHGDTLAIAWREVVGGASEVMLRWSVKGVAGLQPPLVVNAAPSGTQDLPDVAFRNREVHVVWQDDEHTRVVYRKGTIVPAVGVGEEQAKAQLRLWPNPASDFMSIDAPQAGQLQIVDMTGKVVLRQPVGQGEQQVRISGLAGGLYQVLYQSASGESQWQKMVVR